MRSLLSERYYVDLTKTKACLPVNTRRNSLRLALLGGLSVLPLVVGIALPASAKVSTSHLDPLTVPGPAVVPHADPLTVPGPAVVPHADPLTVPGPAVVPHADPLTVPGPVVVPHADPLTVPGPAVVPHADPLTVPGPAVRAAC